MHRCNLSVCGNEARNKGYEKKEEIKP